MLFNQFAISAAFFSKGRNSNAKEYSKYDESQNMSSGNHVRKITNSKGINDLVTNTGNSSLCSSITCT